MIGNIEGGDFLTPETLKKSFECPSCGMSCDLATIKEVSSGIVECPTCGEYYTTKEVLSCVIMTKRQPFDGQLRPMRFNDYE